MTSRSHLPRKNPNGTAMRPNSRKRQEAACVCRAQDAGFCCLGKAALKTHALQTLTRDPLTPSRARSVWSGPDLSALSLRRGHGRRFMAAMHDFGIVQALHEPQFPNPNDESPNPKEYRNRNDEAANRTPERCSTFELRISFVIYNSSLVIRQYIRTWP